MQKKLNGWQIALLIIFYPAGIIYLIVKHSKKKKIKTQTKKEVPKVDIKYTFVDHSSNYNSHDRSANVECEFLPLVTKKAIRDFLTIDSYVVLDLETSGLSKYKNEIIEVAMIKIINGVEFDKYHTLVRPSQPIDSKITKITGITNEELTTAPSFLDIAGGIVDFIGDLHIIAHNAKFDIGFLSEALEPKTLSIKAVDTLSMAKKALPNLENYKLETLIKHYNISSQQQHRALDDAKCTQKLFVLLCNEILTHINKRDENK